MSPQAPSPAGGSGSTRPTSADPALPPPDPLAEVVVALAVPKAWSYRIPPSLAGRLSPGHRVRVPFRGRSRPGVVVSVGGGGPPSGPLATIEALLDPVPALTPALVELARSTAAETASALGEVIFRALPPAARVAAPEKLPGPAAPVPTGPVVLATGPGRHGLLERAVAQALGHGHGALVLAPAIEVARAMARRLDARLAVPTLLVTGEETPRRRWQMWWAARGGEAPVVVGTRASAFSPIRGLGLTVVVDEEDPAHKAADAPHWHARELALRRVVLEGGAGLLTSAAPSLESWVRHVTGDLVGVATETDPWPAVRLSGPGDADRSRALGDGLRQAAREALDRGQSVLLVLNRLGYGRGLGCAECGAVRRCPSCRVALLYHQAARAVACRLCGLRLAAASLCSRCRGRRLRALGWGTERVEVEAREAFPGEQVVRFDSEVGPAGLEAARTRFARQEARVLVGTQMAVRLVDLAPIGVAALVDVDATLGLPDFRAAERTFQAAWRLAEGVAPGGTLWLQSRWTEHPALQAVATGDRERFYRAEWAERLELGFPPARRMARLLVQGPAADTLAGTLAERGRALAVDVLGPSGLPGARIQVVLLGDSDLPARVAELLAPWRGRRRLGRTRLTVDVDPVEFP